MAIHHKTQGYKAIHPPMFVQSTDPAADPANDVQPNIFWLDTTGGATLEGGAILKQRNSGNTAWTTRLNLAAIEGVANGLATLDGAGKVPTTQLPALAINDVFTVASQAAMLALTAQRGDIAIRTDVGKTFVLSTDSPGTLADWVELKFSGTGLPYTVPFIIDGGGAAIAVGVKGDIGPFDFAGTIERVTLLADQAGSIVVDIWKDSYANFPPTVADTITAAAKPTLASATTSQDSTLTGWTTTINDGDILRFNVDSATTVTRVTLTFKIRRN